MGLQYKLIIVAVFLLVIAGLSVTVHLLRGEVSLLTSRNEDLNVQIAACVDVSDNNVENIDELRRSYESNLGVLKVQLQECNDALSVGLSDCASDLLECKSHLRECVSISKGDTFTDPSDVVLFNLNNLFNSFE